ncbi:YkgJ family cysteine cluster protein [Schlesneria paludicola]|uniref:YkgJ family cysteine cluster protein n=1 Tax=Schlesneria paludicola TaxID=360056 RepID=UPI001ED9434B|nr:YkgJ family cysteine cluster protein [Schlesneria paludicola]
MARAIGAASSRSGVLDKWVTMILTLPLLPPDSCEGCGLCCEGIGSPVLLYASRHDLPEPHPFRPVDLPQALIDEINDHFAGLVRGQEPQAACLWFDPQSRSCQHYSFRPQVCRDYELGGRSCLQRRRQDVTS